ncbi:MAG: preprotein translocase subunit SecE [Proteobacteria bacterium]|nr:preprotein translocase subunit SecE [Pseudomonadota bacterium]
MGRILKKKPDSQKTKLKSKQKNSSELDSTAAGSAGKVDVPKSEVIKRPASQARTNGPKKGNASQEPGFYEKSQIFLREVKAELKKVVWPSKNQTVASTVVVIVLVIIVSSFLGFFDLCLNGLIRMVLH